MNSTKQPEVHQTMTRLMQLAMKLESAGQSIDYLIMEAYRILRRADLSEDGNRPKAPDWKPWWVSRLHNGRPGDDGRMGELVGADSNACRMWWLGLDRQEVTGRTSELTEVYQELRETLRVTEKLTNRLFTEVYDG